MPDFERKTIPLTALKAVDEGNGGFAGYGSTFGNVDSYGDIVVKGAFLDTIPSFLKSGFNPVGHDWGDLPVAMPTAAKEDERGLFIEAAFHSTQYAQDARAVISERAAAGKDVGLSIGYHTDAYEMVTSELAYSSGLAQPGDPEHWMGGYRLLKKLTLHEVSIVTVPANAEAVVTAVKSHERMTFAEHIDYADGLVSGLKAFADRVRSRTDARVKEGRVLSEANRKRIGTHLESLRGVADDIEALLAATEPKTDEDAKRLIERVRDLTATRTRLFPAAG